MIKDQNGCGVRSGNGVCQRDRGDRPAPGNHSLRSVGRGQGTDVVDKLDRDRSTCSIAAECGICGMLDSLPLDADR
ncbi:MAG: hypothetical protein U9Q71_10325 [Pseudomonadota bacterium]|nr:hypothetical protein [Pseudomonadota bacterium]